MNWSFPKQSKFGKIITKETIYKQSQANKKTKDLFVQEVKRITWAYKLSSKTLNIPSNNEIPEIQVIEIELHQRHLSSEILRILDKIIPSQILFCLRYQTAVCFTMAYKTVSATQKTTLKSKHFYSTWFDSSAYPTSLPVTINLKQLYRYFLSSLLPYPPRENESLTETLERIEKIQKYEQDIKKLAQRIQRERQFNRKVELNQKMQSLEKTLNTLKNHP